MDLVTLFIRLKAADIRLYLEENQLRFSAPSGGFPDDLKILVIENKTDLIDFLQKQDSKNLFLSPLPSIDNTQATPLSSAQQRFWYLEQLSPHDKAWQLSNAFVLQKKDGFDIPALQASFSDIIQKHTLWHSRFDFALVDGKNTLCQFPSHSEVTQQAHLLPIIKVNKQHSIKDIQRQLTQRDAENFNLQTAYTYTAALYVWPDSQQLIFYFCAHHIIADGVSLALFAKQLLSSYNYYCLRKITDVQTIKNVNNNNTKPKEAIHHYTQWANFENSAPYQNNSRRLVNFWKSYLKDHESLSLHQYKPSIPQSSGDKKINYTLSSQENKAWTDFSRQQQITPFIIGLALYQITLQRLTQVSHFCIGTPLSQRENYQTETILGPLINVLPIQNINQLTLKFSDYCQQLEQAFKQIFEHRHTPFDQLVKQLSLPYGRKEEPIFQTLYNFKSIKDTSNINAMEQQLLKETGISIEALDTQQVSAQYRLQLMVSENEDSKTELQVNYKSDAIDTLFAETILQSLQSLVQQVFNDAQPVQDINLLSYSDIAHYQPFTQNKANSPSIKAKSFYQQFLIQAQRSPLSPAVSYQQQTLNYSELLELSNNISLKLQRIGIQANDCIGLQLRPCLTLPALLLAINAIGAHYSPVSPEAPKFRAIQLFKQCEACLIIADNNTQASLTNNFPASITLDTLLNWQVGNTPLIQIKSLNSQPIESIEQRPLFAIFHTSGSTGTPKSVALSQDAMNNRLNWMQQQFPLQQSFPSGSSARVLHKTDFSFDVSVWEIFWPLLNGQQLIIAPQDTRNQQSEIYRLLHQKKISHCHFVPSLLQSYLNHEDKHSDGTSSTLTSLRHIFSSGEALSPSLLKSAASHFPNSQITNLYGPTEAAIDVSFHITQPEDINRNSLPIGKSIKNMSIFIVDQHLQILPLGACGEIILCGDNLAEAYINNPEANQQSFIELVLPKALIGSSHKNTVKAYRTGDYGRFSLNKNQAELLYLGRHDQQIKLRGQRIELQEINHLLEKHNAITQAFSDFQDNCINTYYVSQGELNEHDKPSIESLKQYLLSYLPASYCPKHLIEIAEFPLMTNGKIDKTRLPQTEATRRENYFSATPLIGPSNATEEKLISLWQELLEVDTIGIYDDFFTLGGHSILAMQMLHRCQQLFEVNLAPNDSLKEPTIKVLAQAIELAIQIQNLQSNNDDLSNDEEEFTL